MCCLFYLFLPCRFLVLLHKHGNTDLKDNFHYVAVGMNSPLKKVQASNSCADWSEDLWHHLDLIPLCWLSSCWWLLLLISLYLGYPHPNLCIVGVSYFSRPSQLVLSLGEASPGEGWLLLLWMFVPVTSTGASSSRSPAPAESLWKLPALLLGWCDLQTAAGHTQSGSRCR